jgi:hypothetical protein
VISTVHACNCGDSISVDVVCWCCLTVTGVHFCPQISGMHVECVALQIAMLIKKSRKVENWKGNNIKLMIEGG